MTDKELREMLELAAKAAFPGKCWKWHDGDQTLCLYNERMRSWYRDDFSNRIDLSPHLDDGDSRRLEVALGIQVTPYPIYAEPKHSVLARKCRLGNEENGLGEPDTGSIEWIELYGDDPCAATRLAVLRVAAEIGKEGKR